MVIFDKLSFSDDKDKILLEVHIPDVSYYKDRYIDTVVIDTQETVLEHFTSPSENAVYTYKVDEGTNTKTLYLEISKAQMDTFTGNMSKTMFFIYVKTKGKSFPANTPCGQDLDTTLGILYDKSAVYNKIMQYVKEVPKECSIPKGFIDLILKLEALDISLITKHYVQAERFFNMIFSELESKTSPTCNCDGRNII